MRDKPGLAIAIMAARKRPHGAPPPEPMDDADVPADDMDAGAFDDLAHALKSGDAEAGLAALRSLVHSCMAHDDGEMT